MEPLSYFPFWSILLVTLIAGGYLFYYFYYYKSEKTQDQTNAYLNALKYMAEGDNRLAIEKFKEAVREDSENIDAYLKLGDILRSEGLYQNAVKIHRDLSLRTTIDEDVLPKIWNSLALDYWKIDKPELAEPLFKKLINSKEYKIQAAPYLVHLYEKSSRYQEASKLIEDSGLNKIDKYRQKLTSLKILQALKIQDSNSKEARTLFKEVIKRKPDCVLAAIYLGDLYLKDERVDDAQKIWGEFCNTNPQKAHLLFTRLEKVYFEKGSFAEIQKIYESIFKDDPTALHAYLALSEILRKKGEPESAYTVLEDGLKQNPNDDLLTRQLVKIQFEQKKYQDAAKAALTIFDKPPGTTNKLFSCSSCGLESADPFIKCSKCDTIQELV